MARAGYTLPTAGIVSLTAATAKSVLGVRAGASFGLDLHHASVSFAGVTATDVPVLVEFCYCTFATNSTPGTNNTDAAASIIQEFGKTIAHGCTAMKAWTAEPTVLTVIDEQLLTPNGGLVKWEWPVDTTPDSAVSEGFVIRCNAPQAQSVRATMKWMRN